MRRVVNVSVRERPADGFDFRWPRIVSANRPMSDIVVMAEVSEEAGYVRHHPKKIALIFAAMRKFARALEEAGWRVAYSQLDDTDNAGSIVGELLRRAGQYDAQEVLATEPGEWRLITALKYAPLKVHILQDDRFIASHKAFEDWADGRKQLRMEYFYRDMRRKTGLLMEGDQPVGGKWNFDHDNRKPAPDDIAFDRSAVIERTDLLGCQPGRDCVNLFIGSAHQ